MNKLGLIENANSACGDFLQSRLAHFLDRPLVSSSLFASHDYKNSSTILEFADDLKLAQDTRIAYTKNIKIKSKNPYKSFCYFLLLQKVESPLLLNHNLPSGVILQNLAQILRSPRKKQIQVFLMRNRGCVATSEEIRLGVY